ncbi:MAG: hypothetical protein SCK57_11745 [Bacillota bacterium]|nr:hypothetical protein [Bacillota bacterium]MDW7678324.1 hypothetical protein [Bacillota bacterium]
MVERLDKEQILFRHEERFHGILVPVLWKKTLNQQTRRGFEAMNHALKELVENRQA